jgi:hypothetical protein
MYCSSKQYDIKKRQNKLGIVVSHQFSKALQIESSADLACSYKQDHRKESEEAPLTVQICFLDCSCKQYNIPQQILQVLQGRIFALLWYVVHFGMELGES